MFSWVGTSNGFVKRLVALEDKLQRHIEDYVTFQGQIFNRFDQHEAQVRRLHEENQKGTADTLAAVNELKGSTAVFDQMLPAIKAGIEDDARRGYRKKLANRIIATVFTTLVAVSGLIPLAQILIGLKIHVYFNGH